MADGLPLLDFLYSDHERVASFLSQLDGSGVPQKREQTASKGKKDSGKLGVKLGPLDAGLGQDKDWRKEIRLTYDPLWVNSQTLINYVEDNNSFELKDDPKIGQLRIIKGSLIVYDLSSLTSMMNSDAMDDFIGKGISTENMPDSRSKKFREDHRKKEGSVIRNFIKGLPLGIGFVLVSDDAHFWFGVKREYISLYELDIPFKFPTHISGSWNVLGVIDALPQDHVEGIQHIIDKNIDGLIPSMVLNMMELTGTTVGMFGRPFPAYGLSPLVIYREVII